MKFRNYLLLAACLLNGLPQQAQFSEMDSLYSIWVDSARSEIVRLEAFYNLIDQHSATAWYLVNNQFTAGAVEGHQPEAGIETAIELARKHGKDAYLGHLYRTQGEFYYYNNASPELRCEALDNAMRYAMDMQDHLCLIQTSVLMFWADCVENHDRYSSEGIVELIDSLAVVVDADQYHRHQRRMYYLMGEVYLIASRLPDALQAFRKAAELARDQDIEDYDFRETLRGLGDIQLIIGNYLEAREYFRKCLQLATDQKDTISMGGFNIGLAQTYIKTDQIDKAIDHLEHAIHIMEDVVGCAPCLAKARVVRISIDNLLGNHEKALRSLLELLPLYTAPPTADYPNNPGQFYSELGLAYLGVGQYESAIDMAETGLKYAVENNYQVLIEASEAMGDYRKALESYKQHITIQDSLTALRNAQEVIRLELESQFEQKRLTDSLRIEQQKLEAELALTDQINRQRNNRNIVLGLGIVLFLLAVTMYHRLRLIHRTEKALKAKNTIIEAEKEKARASERAKHQFLANMSHEIRTPMNAIKGMTDILLRRDPKPEQQEYLDGIRQSSDAMLVIINDILDLSKIEAGKIELEQIPFAVAEVLDNVVTIMRFKAEEKGLVIHTDIPDELSPVEGDPSRLQQVLLNLVGNAIKFTEKGSISLSVRETPLTDQQTQLHFIVADTGVGIDPDRLDRIFENFQQAYTDTSRKYGGSGLGLSISKKLVELQGGEIWVESKHGKGSQFHVTIPYTIAGDHIEGAALGAPGASSDFATRLQGIRILLVEDNHFNAMVAREELEDAIEDVVVDVAENGSIALEMLRADAYDVILMDVQMPVMNGYEATKAIRQMQNGMSGIPVIAMTANVLKEEVDQCFAAGMDDFIGKPFETDALLQKISFQLDGTKLPDHGTDLSPVNPSA
ncbi:MAG: ATP-binding protein [Saprospiraceae bacterium]|nr:ATP-binding protein [Saprospiraceae bacterium]